MTTNALAILRAAVGSATSPDAKAEALARVGVCLAQLGRIDEAREILASIRQDYSKGRFPRVSVRLMILEGVIPYYENIVNSADRVRRAYTLAKAGNIVDLQAEASVWMAHLAFNFEDYSMLEQALSDALNGFYNLDNSHRARLCLIIADTLQYLANRSAASDWYTLARIFSRKAHDHGVMTAIEYNRLSIGLSRIRVDFALGRATNSLAYRDWLGELGSVERLHIGFDSRALSELLELCGAYTHEIREEFKEAHAALARILESGAVERYGVSELLLRIELEWCRSKVEGFFAESDTFKIDLAEIESLSQNDRLIALTFLKDTQSETSLRLNQERCIQMMRDAIRSFEQTESDMSAAIGVAKEYYKNVRSIALTENA